MSQVISKQEKNLKKWIEEQKQEKSKKLFNSFLNASRRGSNPRKYRNMDTLSNRGY